MGREKEKKVMGTGRWGSFFIASCLLLRRDVQVLFLSPQINRGPHIPSVSIFSPPFTDFHPTLLTYNVTNLLLLPFPIPPPTKYYSKQLKINCNTKHEKYWQLLLGLYLSSLMGSATTDLREREAKK